MEVMTMRKFLLTLVALVLWVALVVGGVLITYNDVWIETDENGNTMWDNFIGSWKSVGEAPFYYFGDSEDTTPPAETPGDEVPGDETPGYETPGDETPGGDQNITE
jgi:hypothetical protein